MMLPKQHAPAERLAARVQPTTAGAEPNGVGPSSFPCAICDVGKAACYVSPVPNFICDAAYAVCRSQCS
jgi:hypothetical protein